MGASAMPIISGIGLVSQIAGQNSAQKAANSASKSQQAMLKKLQPFIDAMQAGALPIIPGYSELAQRGLTDARQYDPAQETARGLSAYDAATRDVVRQNLGEVNSSFTGRGFSAGNQSSDQGALNQNVLARAAADRGRVASELTLGETGRKQQVYANASGMAGNTIGTLNPVSAANGTASSFGQSAAGYQNQANQYNPAGALMGLAELLRPRGITNPGIYTPPSLPHVR